MLKQYGSVLGRVEQTMACRRDVGRDLGAGDGFRRQHRKISDHTLACDAGVRLPPLRHVKAELIDALRIVETRRPRAAGNARRLAGENRPNPVHASSWIKFAVGFRRQRPPRSYQERARRAGLNANFLASHGWQRGKDWEPGRANFAVIQQWNKSEVYAKTIGYFASQLARAP